MLYESFCFAYNVFKIMDKHTKTDKNDLNVVI